MIRSAAALGLAGLLAACDGGGDPVEQALRETAAAHQAAATRTTAEIEAAAAPRRSTTDQVHVARMIVHNEEAKSAPLATPTTEACRPASLAWASRASASDTATR